MCELEDRQIQAVGKWIPWKVEDVNHSYTTLLQYKEDSLVLKIKLPYHYNHPMTKYYNQQNNAITSDHLTSGKTVIALLETKGVWYDNHSNKFGYILNASQIKIYFDNCH